MCSTAFLQSHREHNTTQYLISRHNPLLPLPEQSLASKALPPPEPPAPGEQRKDPRVAPELERNQHAKTQGKKPGSRKLLLGSCIFPGAKKGDSAISSHVGPALDPAGAGKLNPSLSPEAAQQACSNHTTLLLAAFTCGYNEWILPRTPKNVLVSHALLCCLVSKLIIVLLYCYTVIHTVAEPQILCMIYVVSLFIFGEATKTNLGIPP